MKLSYSQSQFDAAVDYIQANNPFSKKWSYQNVRDTLKDSLQSLVDNPLLVETSTMGFHCVNTGDGYIDILVTPYFSDDNEIFSTIGECEDAYSND